MVTLHKVKESIQVNDLTLIMLIIKKCFGQKNYRSQVMILTLVDYYIETVA